MCDAGEGGAILITGSAFADVLVEENDNLVPFHCGSYEFSNSNKFLGSARTRTGGGAG